MSIKDACRPGVLVIAKFSKEGCISPTIGGKLFRAAHRQIEISVGPFQFKKHTPPK